MATHSLDSSGHAPPPQERMTEERWQLYRNAINALIGIAANAGQVDQAQALQHFRDECDRARAREALLVEGLKPFGSVVPTPGLPHGTRLRLAVVDSPRVPHDFLESDVRRAAALLAPPAGGEEVKR